MSVQQSRNAAHLSSHQHVPDSDWPPHDSRQLPLVSSHLPSHAALPRSGCGVLAQPTEESMTKQLRENSHNRGDVMWRVPRVLDVRVHKQRSLQSQTTESTEI